MLRTPAICTSEIRIEKVKLLLSLLEEKERTAIAGESIEFVKTFDHHMTVFSDVFDSLGICPSSLSIQPGHRCSPRDKKHRLIENKFYYCYR